MITAAESALSGNFGASRWRPLRLRVTELRHGLQHPYLQCLCRLAPPPSIGRRNEYRPLGWITIPNGDADVALLTAISWRILCVYSQCCLPCRRPPGVMNCVIVWSEWTPAMTWVMMTTLNIITVFYYWPNNSIHHNTSRHNKSPNLNLQSSTVCLHPLLLFDSKLCTE